MKRTIKALILGSSSTYISFPGEEPEICPICKFAIQPQELSSIAYRDNNSGSHVATTYLCKHCYSPFLAHFELHGIEPNIRRADSSTLVSVEPNCFVAQDFNAHLVNVSPSFVEIYNQALAAETASLDQIAGMGYRKALEFLIKDFLIHDTPEDAEKIKRMELANCIANKVTNEKLKIVASRCAWLGNDQTHYIQRFSEYDIKYLKLLLNTAVSWIISELVTEEALEIEPRDR